MNPIFVLLVFMGVIAVWFLLSFMYKPIGKFFSRIWRDSIKEIKENKKESKDER